MLKAGSRWGWPVLVVLLGFGCGEDGQPSPGFSDPCDTPMAGTIGCPATPGVSNTTPTTYDACQKLVSCGILAGEYLRRSSTSCSTSADCTGGQCLSTSDGDRCHWSYLDYRWCVGHLSNPGRDPCTNSQSFTDQQIESALQCIWTTPCTSLGLLFWQKRISQNRPELDKFTCADGEETIWTATICDYGLLEY